MWGPITFKHKMGEMWLFVVFIGMFGTTTCTQYLNNINKKPEDLRCYTRFEYEYNVIHHLVTLKEAETELRETINQLKERVSHLEKSATTEVKGKTMERVESS